MSSSRAVILISNAYIMALIVIGVGVSFLAIFAVAFMGDFYITRILRVIYDVLASVQFYDIGIV
jgi:hypothetical protein